MPFFKTPSFPGSQSLLSTSTDASERAPLLAKSFEVLQQNVKKAKMALNLAQKQQEGQVKRGLLTSEIGVMNAKRDLDQAKRELKRAESKHARHEPQGCAFM